ncbi:hypothetical protein ACQCN2_18725 [Brevibacillus ginsengisoli]|uniref:hypothetical protein n=1 Tax=Brevibacillus ginsengisoli TaxID=363854 RepID=UPI003CFA5359
MIFNFVFFTVRIERSSSSAEEQIAHHRQAELFRQREEAQVIEAAQFPNFVGRI